MTTYRPHPPLESALCPRSTVSHHSDPDSWIRVAGTGLSEAVVPSVCRGTRSEQTPGEAPWGISIFLITACVD